VAPAPHPVVSGLTGTEKLVPADLFHSFQQAAKGLKSPILGESLASFPLENTSPLEFPVRRAQEPDKGESSPLLPSCPLRAV